MAHESRWRWPKLPIVAALAVLVAGWIIVKIAPQPPAVDAGPDLTVVLTDTVALSGKARDGAGVRWSMVEGPWPVEFDPPTSAATTAEFSAIGSYVLELVVTVGDRTSIDVTEITVVGPAGPPARGLPEPLLLTTQRPSGGYFQSREDDFARIAEVFNAVTVPARGLADGDLGDIEAAEAAGLVPIADTDLFGLEAGRLVEEVDALVAGFNAHPGRVPAIRLADELNEGTGDPQILLDYLAATACRIKQETSGVLTLVDVGAAELRGNPGPDGWYSVVVLDLMVDQGCLDGFLLSNGSRDGDDRDFTESQYQQAAARWPSMHIFARTSRLSFAEDEMPWSDAPARVDALGRAALDAGAHGLHLWAWHQPTSDGIRKYLNADGTGNQLWQALQGLSREVPGP